MTALFNYKMVLEDVERLMLGSDADKLRPKLRDMAVDRKLLVTTWGYFDCMDYQNHEVDVDAFSRLSNEFKELMTLHYGGDDDSNMLPVLAEIKLWRGYIPEFWESNSLDERVKILRLMRKYPASYHDYIRVGLTDIEFIKRCIAGGVDAELATGLSV